MTSPAIESINHPLSSVSRCVATLPVHVHIPTPGDHYSATTGSSAMTVIYQMARHHGAAGGETQIVVSEGTRQDYREGKCLMVKATRLVTGWRKVADVLSGRFALPRFFGEKCYRPAATALPRSFDGVIFVHNDPAPMRLLRRMHPHATLCLWLHNHLFRTYSRAEVEAIESTVDHFICCSRYIAGTIEGRLGRPCPKARVVHNGVDTVDFQPRPRSHNPGPPVILFVGRVNPVKGVDLLIRAAGLLMEKGCDFRLRIVGNAGFSANAPLTPYETQLRELAAPLGKRVEFVPFTDRHLIAGEYQDADIFCAPSNWDEPFGLTIAEAMACGLPVVTSRRGGIPEFAGENVLYFDPPNIKELADQLRLLVGEPALREHWARRAASAAPNLDWSKSYQRLLLSIAV